LLSAQCAHNNDTAIYGPGKKINFFTEIGRDALPVATGVQALTPHGGAYLGVFASKRQIVEISVSDMDPDPDSIRSVIQIRNPGPDPGGQK
jgi:hypothetical protein